LIHYKVTSTLASHRMRAHLHTIKDTQIGCSCIRDCNSACSLFKDEEGNSEFTTTKIKIMVKACRQKDNTKILANIPRVHGSREQITEKSKILSIFFFPLVSLLF